MLFCSFEGRIQNRTGNLGDNSLGAGVYRTEEYGYLVQNGFLHDFLGPSLASWGL